MIKREKKLFLLFVLVAILCLCLWVGFGGIFALNFVFAILSFSLIVSIVFYTQKRKIQSLIQNATQEELEALSEAYKSKQEIAEEEEEEFWEELESQDSKSHISSSTPIKPQQDFKPSKVRFWQNFSAQNTKTGAKMFFYPLRLLAYGFLALGILILIQHQIFHSLAFFSGLIVANIFIVLALLIRN
ncbi:hypothetical protein [Helicobacter sp.]|uniref:hypothetical protein n=1 Tax=Helicobacter sp. TaxID=218 RepID=UPI00198BB38D|nr:hypothetical protein [Helicobacter sp.]MBD5164746.1 hypothetical protein [Helicobacter sp.]